MKCNLVDSYVIVFIFIYLITFVLNYIECENRLIRAIKKTTAPVKNNNNNKQNNGDDGDGDDDDDEILSQFNVPKDDPDVICLKMIAKFEFNVTYEVLINNRTSYRNRVFSLDSVNHTHTGSCLSNQNMLEIELLDDWRLELYFSKPNNNTYALSYVTMYYKFSGQFFQNSIHKGAHSEVFDKQYFNATLGTSFMCDSGVYIDLGDVKLNLTNIQVQPFFNRAPKQQFDKAIRCYGDSKSISKNSGLIAAYVIGTLMAVALVVILMIYCVKKCNPYQSLKS